VVYPPFEEGTFEEGIPRGVVHGVLNEFLSNVSLNIEKLGLI
jgi:hypothetical protein